MQTASHTQNLAFRAFLSRDDIRLQRCTDCGYLRPPTGFICPQCLSERWDWSKIGGGAVVEACTWYMQPLHPRYTDVPYNVALVRLDEGVRMIANVEEVTRDQLRPGQRLRAKVAIGREGNPVIAFKPDTTGAPGADPDISHNEETP